VFAACTQTPDADKAVTEAPKKEVKAQEKSERPVISGLTYQVDFEKSKVSFVGSTPVKQHTGDFKISAGSMRVEKGQVLAGNFKIDLESLQITDLKGKKAEKLRGHLLSEDFFNADVYKSCIFGITKMEKHNVSNQQMKMAGATHVVTGNLTLLGVTKSIKFPAIIKGDKELNIKATFNINRNDWGISYGNDESLKDRFIRPDVNITLDVFAS